MKSRVSWRLLPSDFIKKVKQINSQSDLILGLPARLIVQPDPVCIIYI